MTTKTFIVPNISCGHCTHTIETELADMPGVTKVKADLDTKQVTVEWNDPATWTKIESTFREIDYAPAG